MFILYCVEAGAFLVLVPWREEWLVFASGMPWPWLQEAMLWPVLRSAAELLTSEEAARVRQCASETCSWLFVDRSRTHRRRWCDMKTCGNRDKARRYYQRHREKTAARSDQKAQT